MNRAGSLSVGQILTTIMVLAVAAIILPKVVGGGGGSEPPALEAPAAEPAAVGRAATALVDPARYRQTIQDLEAMLYQESTPDLATGDRISSLATQLGSAVLSTESRVVATQAGQRLMGFAGRIGAESDVGYATVNLPRAREMWEEVRGEVFQPASWFRGASSTLTSAQTPAPPVSPAAAVRSLENVASQLERLITLGKREVSRFPDPYSLAPGSAALRSQQTAYRDWSVQWTERINRVLGLMPVLPPNVNTNLHSAFQELQSAARELNEVGQTMNPAGIPTEGERASFFNTAEGFIAHARRSLSQER